MTDAILVQPLSGSGLVGLSGGDVAPDGSQASQLQSTAVRCVMDMRQRVWPGLQRLANCCRSAVLTPSAAPSSAVPLPVVSTPAAPPLMLRILTARPLSEGRHVPWCAS